LPTPEELEVADLLLVKAASDLSAARALASDPAQHDDVVGFHAQQAVEKSLKAVLAVRGFEIPRTHDLDLLTRLVSPGVAELPNELGDAKRLSPWAVATRYDEVEATLDRERALAIAESSLTWARSVVDGLRAEGSASAEPGGAPSED
jgi:HEPN domain-containing protein